MHSHVRKRITSINNMLGMAKHYSTEYIIYYSELSNLLNSLDEDSQLFLPIVNNLKLLIRAKFLPSLYINYHNNKQFRNYVIA